MTNRLAHLLLLPLAMALPLFAMQKPVAPDAARAFRDVRRQVEIGPRPPGSAGSARAQKAIAQALREAGLTVTIDRFTDRTPTGTGRFANVIGERRGTSGAIIYIACHYDTKLFRDFVFVGANDGASGVGAVLEIARNVAQRSDLQATYRFVFFDGEEALCTRWSECLDGMDHLYGSRHEIGRLRRNGELSRVRAMILLDMIGERDLQLRRDLSSTSWLVDVIWRHAAALQCEGFVDETQQITGDDHTPFLEAGIPAVDLIDLRYPAWHTAADTLEQVSPASLGRVIETVLAALQEIESMAGVENERFR
jgi:glutaminyl-peptide cyclotransferase